MATGRGGGITEGDDGVDVGGLQGCREFGEPFGSPFAGADIEFEVASLEKTVRRQSFQDAVTALVHRGDSAGREQSDPIGFARLLRARAERPKEGATDDRDELAPTHAMFRPE